MERARCSFGKLVCFVKKLVIYAVLCYSYRVLVSILCMIKNANIHGREVESMKHKGKKILSLLLAVLMLVGLAVPTGILAPIAWAASITPALTSLIEDSTILAT